MPDTSNFLIFAAASWALILTPGPDMIYVITRGIAQGRKAALVSSAGITLGILVHTFFAAFGMAMILRTSALAFTFVKYLGAAYLVYLGIKALRERNGFTLDGEASPARMHTVFVQGLLSNVLNPKVALFFLAFLPQFATPAAGSIPLQMLSYGFTFAFFGILALLAISYSCGAVGAWLAKRPWVASKIRWFTGSILIALGLRLAFVRRG